MVMRPNGLILKQKFFWIVLTWARREGLISIWTKEYLICAAIMKEVYFFELPVQEEVKLKSNRFRGLWENSKF